MEKNASQNAPRFASLRRMKITRIEPILVTTPYTYGGIAKGETATRWPTMDTLLVKVETDQGLTGWGEAFGFSSCATTCTAIDSLIAPAALGRDPSDIPALMADLHRKLHTYGRSGPVYYGLSGLDIALWDIAGQIAGKSIARLLSDDAATMIPSYASLLRYDDAELAARNAADAVGRGYTRIKLHEIGVAEVKAAREAIGPKIELTLDTNCRWDPTQALTHARSMEPFNLTFIEEPVWPPEDYDRLREVSRGTRTAIAAGENHTTLSDFERLIDVGGVRYIQPSVTKVGGITAMIEIIAMAHARGVAVAPHSPYFGPGLIAAAHLCASIAREAALEQFYATLEARPFDGGVGVTSGTIQVPVDPGLGVKPDEAVIARCRVA